MSDYNLGTAHGVIQIDYQGNGVTQATQGLGQASASATSADEAMKKVGNTTTVAGASIAAGLGLAVKTAADFEKGLSGIQAVSGATGAEMESIRKKALQLGADTAFSASDASAAMEELVKAGIQIPDVLNGAADATVALAAAGGVELPEAATIAANAMNQFGLTSKELPRIVDQIAGAANASAIDVSELGQSMSQVGAVANLAGLSFDDTALAITAMGNAGIKGSDAGTSLKTMLQNLQPQTEKQIGLMQELGLATFNAQGAQEFLRENGVKPLGNSQKELVPQLKALSAELAGVPAGSKQADKAFSDLMSSSDLLQNQFFKADGSIKSMSEIAGVLGKSLEGMSQQQKSAALQTLFGSDAIRAAAVIADQGSAGMDKLAASVGKVSAADVAATRMKNLSGQVEQLKGSAETLAIGLGSVFIPVLNQVVGGLTSAVNWFTSLDEGTQKGIAITAAFVAGLLLFVGAVIKVTMAINAAKVAMLALNGTFLANPITWIVIAIVALIAAIVLLWKNSETFRNIVMAVWNAVKTAISAVVDWVTGTAVPWIVDAWNTISDGAKSLWNRITAAWNAIGEIISSVLNFIKAVVSAVWGFIVAYITTYINIVRTIITTVMNVILGIWNAVWGLFGPLVMAVWELIKTVIQLGLYYVQLVITTVMNVIKGIWTTVWNGIVSVLTAIWNVIKTVVLTYINFVLSIVNAVMNRVRSIWTAVWGAIKSFVSSIWSAIVSAVSGPLNAIWSRVQTVINAVKNFISNGFTAAKNLASRAFEAMVQAVYDKMSAIRDRIKSIIDTVKGFFSGAGTWLLDAGRRIIQGLADGIRNAVGAVTDSITSVTDKIRGFLPGSPIKEGPLKDHGWNEGAPGKKLVQFVAGGVESDMDALNAAFATLSPDLSVGVAGVGASLADSAARTAGRGSGGVATAVAPRTQIVEGRLSIDPSGRAYITGVAQEVVDNQSGYDGVRSRMNGRN